MGIGAAAATVWNIHGLVVAGGDASLLLELAEHALDTVAIFVAPIVRMDRHFPVRAWRDDGQNAAHEHVFPEPVAIISLVGQQCLGLGQRQRHQVISGCIIRCLAAGQDEADGEPLIVTAGVDFTRKAAA